MEMNLRSVGGRFLASNSPPVFVLLIVLLLAEARGVVVHELLCPGELGRQNVILELGVGTIPAVMDQVGHLEKVIAAGKEREQQHSKPQVDIPIFVQFPMYRLVCETKTKLHHKGEYNG
jgi:hypothetical protein